MSLACREMVRSKGCGAEGLGSARGV